MFKSLTDVVDANLEINTFSFIKLPRCDTKHSAPRFPIIISQMNIELHL